MLCRPQVLARSLHFPRFNSHLSNEGTLIHSHFQNGVQRITLNSPKTRNALSLEMMTGLRKSLAEAHANDQVRAIVLSGHGPAFSAGHNLKEMTTEDGIDKHREIFQCCNDLMADIVRGESPVIAVVDGLAAAAGCQVVAMCDIVLASERSQFSTPGSSFGVFCSTPGIPLARAVPRKVASYMLLTGKPINAQEALRAGLVSKVVPEEDLEAEVEATCQAIIDKPRAIVTLGKRFFYQQLEMGISPAFERGGGVMVENLKYKDAQEGISAFKEKRKPTWSHTSEKI